MEWKRIRVPLADIRPSDLNPRRDMGDIAALAASIEATGGEPVNPPVVARDGNVWRIVDGERRYRALKELAGGDGGREVAVLAVEGMDAASEAVAMLATDDKRRLDETELSGGVQTMLALGVDEERIERASRATRGQIVAARMMAPLVPEGAQVTLDQMLAASELPGEQAAEVLGAGSSWRYKVSEIKEAERAAERERKIRRAVERSGVPVADGEPEGMARSTTWYDWSGRPIKDLAAMLARYDGSCRAVVDGGNVTVYVPEGFEPEEPVDPVRAELEREKGACADLGRRMAMWLLGSWSEVPWREPELRQAAAARREAPRAVADWGADGMWEDMSAGAAPGRYEVLAALLGIAVRVSLGATSQWDSDDGNARRARAALDGIDLFRLAGFAPADGDAWLMGRLRSVADCGDE